MDITGVVWSLLALAAGCGLGSVLIPLLDLIWGWADGLIHAHREARREKVEAELDRKQDALRRTILHLAVAIAEEHVRGNTASAELIRAAYISRGQLP